MVSDDVRERLVEVGAQGLVSADLHGARGALKEIAATVVEALLESGEVFSADERTDLRFKVDAWLTHAKELEVERDRYRQALEKIADPDLPVANAYGARGEWASGWVDGFAGAAEIARSVLDGEPATDPACPEVSR